MLYTFDRFQTEITEALLKTHQIDLDQIDLVLPKAASVQADLALPCFKAAKQRDEDPARFAAQLASALPPLLSSDSLLGSVQATGPFLNFALDLPRFANAVLTEINERGDHYGWDDLGTGRTIIVDYSSPNIAKRMHIGHIRSTIIGQALVNLLRALGYTVIGDNHLGDWGKQFGVLISAIQQHGLPAGQNDETLTRFEELYATQVGQIGYDAELDNEARQWSLRLEQGDATAREIWQLAIDLTKRINQRNYDRLGVRFDTEHGESFYAHMTRSIIDESLAQGLARRDENGAIVAEVPDLPSFLLQRSDGGTLYHTRDLATIKYRQQTYQPAGIIYVVGKPQELHFKQLFAAAHALGYVTHDVHLVHVMFGTVFDAHGEALSTRKGNMLYLGSLLDEAVRRAQNILEQKLVERSVDFSAAEREQISSAIGIGAVIYNDLYQNPERNITLDWERMLSIDGNSATYLQFAYARCCSIVRRAGNLPQRYNPAQLQHPSEIELIKALGQFPGKVREAAQNYGPHLLAGWLYTSARQFSAFYRDCPVLDAPSDDLRAARLKLVQAFAQCLKNGLALLGIQTPERM